MGVLIHVRQGLDALLCSRTVHSTGFRDVTMECSLLQSSVPYVPPGVALGAGYVPAAPLSNRDRRPYPVHRRGICQQNSSARGLHGSQVSAGIAGFVTEAVVEIVNSLTSFTVYFYMYFICALLFNSGCF